MKTLDFVTDQTGVIDKREIVYLNKTLKALYERDGEDVRFIFISDDVYGDLNDDFLIENNIGDPQRYNGIVIILNMQNNQVKIFVGKGLYLKYPDAFMCQYAEDAIKPQLINKKYQTIIETWIYKHDGSRILSELRANDHMQWHPIALIFPLIFIPFLIYTLFDMLNQVGYIASLFFVGLLSYLIYTFYHEGGFGWLWSQRKSGPWSVFIMMLLCLFTFALLSFYGWILSGILAYICIHVGKKHKRKHLLGLGIFFLLYTTIVFFPSTCNQNKCTTHIGGFTFHHTASEKREYNNTF